MIDHLSAAEDGLLLPLLLLRRVSLGIVLVCHDGVGDKWSR